MSVIEQLLWEIGEAGVRLAQLGALEGAAGNISVFIPAAMEHGGGLETTFIDETPWKLPDESALPYGTLLITGTGRRLRDAARDPAAVLCVLRLDDAGCTLCRGTGSGVRPTSEIDTHLGIHAASAATSGGAMRSVVHAQPPHLTWLSHIPTYREFTRLNRQLLRWQPETIVMLPEGIGVLPFETPGTLEQGRMTTQAATRHRLVVWSRHGVVAHAAGGPLAACDLIEYAEAAARYEVLDIQAGRPADGMSLAEIRSVALRFGVHTELLNELPIERLT